MSAIIPFTFQGAEIRTLVVDGEPWWVASDVSSILGYRMASDATRMLDEDEKGTHQMRTPGGDQNVTVINEPGLYSLILRSRLDEAKAFKRWITHEVIPSIRRTGSYSVEPAAPALPQDYEEALVALLGQVRETKALAAKVAELEPAATSWQVLASGDGDFSVADAAKILSRDPSIKLGRNRLFTLLDEWRWTYRQIADDRPRVMQTAVERGWLSELPQSHYHPRTGELVLDAPQVRVTAKGLNELHKRLAATVKGGAA
ncbi:MULTISPECIES: BRO family protein [unclassified Streptomyces]|uniref:BRO family protein n=1 Tax=unclassified Streptomyces TaxID=2593676 RepID=UPI00195F2A71|nr:MULTISPECIES: BRO family protein [unclassified Streptomyces]